MVGSHDHRIHHSMRYVSPCSRSMFLGAATRKEMETSNPLPVFGSAPRTGLHAFLSAARARDRAAVAWALCAFWFHPVYCCSGYCCFSFWVQRLYCSAHGRWLLTLGAADGPPAPCEFTFHRWAAADQNVI